MFKALTTLALAATLTGCAASSPKTLKADPARKVSVQIDQNYQRVFKNVLDKFQECVGEGRIGVFADMHIKNVMLSDLKEAEISVMMTNLGNYYYYHADIKEIAPGKTQFDAAIIYQTWSRWLDRSVAWAQNGDADCDGVIKKP